MKSIIGFCIGLVIAWSPAILVSYGFWLIYHPLGLICGGVVGYIMLLATIETIEEALKK